MKSATTRRQAGLTAMETLLALAAGALAVLGVVVLYQQIMLTLKVDKTGDQLTTIQASVRTLFENIGTFGNLSDSSDDQPLNTVLIQTNGFPLNMLRNGAPVNPWAGDVVVQAHPRDFTFSVEFQDLPDAACIRMSAFNRGSEPRALWAMRVNTTDFTQNDLPVEVSDATGLCDGDANSLTWFFRK